MTKGLSIVSSSSNKGVIFHEKISKLLVATMLALTIFVAQVEPVEAISQSEYIDLVEEK